jgi:hypothetical protein
MPQSTTQIAAEIRAELRSILRARRDLYAPVSRFEPATNETNGIRYYVLFDLNPRKQFFGLKLAGLKELRLPDESIQDRVLELAKAVWHLKDRLHQYAKAIGKRIDCDAHARQCPALLLCADLANKKKHGRNENRSGLDPHLGTVTFDTSASGAIEFFYDGAMKDKELIVENTVPIKFTVDILGAGEAVLGDARDLINDGFRGWLPLIQKLELLANDDPESVALYSILFT